MKRTLPASDWRNLLLLTTAYLVLVLLITPNRDYAVIDDWIYAQSARHIQLTGGFARHEWSNSSTVALAWWGSLFADLFGYSFTTLTCATLVLSWLGVVCFYALLRALDVAATPALFGAALLLLNPLYLHLTYSFMTDVPFLALVLAATLCVVQGLARGNDRLLLIAMLLTSMATLIRQLGVLVAVALFAYLLLARQASVRRLALVGLPLLVLGLYLSWQRTQPPAIADATYASTLEGYTFANPVGTIQNLVVAMIRGLLILATVGLGLLPLASALLRLRLGRRGILVTTTMVILMLLAYLRVVGPRGFIVDGSQSVLQSSGFLVVGDQPASLPPTLPPAAWFAISLTIIGLTAWLLGGISSRLREKIRLLWRRLEAPRPVDFVYLVGLLLGLSAIAGPRTYDRYMLAVIPFLVTLLLRTQPHWSRPGAAVALLLLIALGGFTLLLQADFMDRAAARWAAGNELLARGIPYTAISAGFEWGGMHFYDEQGQRLPDGLPFAPSRLPYVVAETPVDGYKEIDRVLYFSRLSGFAERAVLVLTRQ